MSSLISVLAETAPNVNSTADETSKRPSVSRVPSAVRRVLGEPLVHFLLLGAALFVAYSLFIAPSSRSASSRIELTSEDLNQLQLTWMAQWKRSPTPEELKGLIDSKVQQEILYREAVSMGLDQNDEIVKRRMAQKMVFLSEDVSKIPEPTREDLKEWFARNSSNFTLPNRITFRHLYFSPDRRGQNAQADAAQVLGRLVAQPAAGTSNPEAGDRLSDRFMDQSYFADCTVEQVAKVFGTKFSESLFKLNPGSWLGPVESGLGWHLVWIEKITPGSIPAFEDVDEAQVKSDWLSQQREQTKQKAFAAIKERYEIVLPK